MKMTDAEGNLWHKQEKREERLNQGVRGAHTVMPFQCEQCWIVNLEKRLPVAGMDDMYLMLIRRANLDAMAGRAESTLVAHCNSIRRTVKFCRTFYKTFL